MDDQSRYDRWERRRSWGTVCPRPGAGHTAPRATITTFGDSVWWSCSTLSTVGYGGVAPVTGSFSSWLPQRFAYGEDERRPPGS